MNQSDNSFSIWHYYNKLDDGTAKCCVGKKCNAIINRINGGTSQMRKHLRKINKMMISFFKKDEQESVFQYWEENKNKYPLLSIVAKK